MARIHHARGDNQTARRLLEQAIQNNPWIPGLHNALGVVLSGCGDHERAIEAFGEAMRLAPTYAEAHYNRANTLARLGRFEDAVRCYLLVRELAPVDSSVAFNTGVALQKLNRHEESVEHLDSALRLGHDPFHTNRALAASLQMTRHYGRAIACFQSALAVAPDDPSTHTDLGMVLLQTGDFRSGWRHYGYRIDGDSSWRQHYAEVPRWDGTPYAGKTLLMLCEQGLGDSLQFIRYLPMAKSRGGRVILAVHRPLYGLFNDLPGADEVVCMGPDCREPVGFDMCCPILDLPGIFDTTLETIPADVPYILTDAGKMAYWRTRLAGPDFAVGIVWGGSLWGQPGDGRSCDLRHFTRLGRVPGVRLFALQKGPGAREIERWPGSEPPANLGDEFEDFSDTAAAIANLDLVVSIDTSVLHLAGAMGRPVWGLLPYEGDWRWLIDRQDSPWYPTMRLFRQSRLGDWANVLEHVAGELAHYAAAFARDRRGSVPILS